MRGVDRCSQVKAPILKPLESSFCTIFPLFSSPDQHTTSSPRTPSSFGLFDLRH
jgi:hypothetical protein